MKVFKCRNDQLMNAMTTAPLLIIWGMMIILLIRDDANLVTVLVTIGLPSFLLLLVLFPRPRYTIDGQYFTYRAGVFRGKIALNKIHKIEVGKTLWVGFKPAAARKGLIIHYNRYEEIYISPDGNDDFVHELLQYNPDIEIVRSA